MMRELIATYRLQLNAGFTLRDAQARVPYLQALGISHLYCSPVLTARRGSTHGYDVADPTQVSEELGGEEALRALASDVHGRGMGLLLDIVPNHMGIGPENPFWDDVLTHGRASKYAEWFDVSWRAPTQRLAGKVLVPILGDTLPKVIERDEITVEVSDQGARIRYFDHHFPLDPSTIPPEIELAMRDPAARSVVAEWGKGVEGRSRMRALLAKQHYELAFWRAAQRDLNYRRFFDVNELISLRVEREDVFNATHRKVLELVREGVVDGLRVDHVDGLLEPKQYLERLRSAVPSGSFPIYVEKILAHNETLPGGWPVDGTTGYEFLVALEDVFIDPYGASAIEESYRGKKEKRGFNRVSVESKRRVLRGTLNADVRRVAPMLATVAKRAEWELCSVAEYAAAVVEYVAALPVYRTYIDSVTKVPSERDRALITQTLDDVRERSKVSSCALESLERTLLGDWSNDDSLAAAARLQFVLRLQQLSGPAAAKGVEDTALYAYAPLTSRSEVGHDPAVPVEGALDRLQERMHERAARFPRSLNATNTHDTKRSADARSRIDALSEHATEWSRTLRRWRRQHRALRTEVNGRLMPTKPADDFAYQSLLAVWPLTSSSLEGDAWLKELKERLTAYLQKASREAKVSTSWTDPDAKYEQALATFVERLLNSAESASFHQEVAQFVAMIAPQALWNSVARSIVHLLSPGVPDIYQGDELWYAALVDPDNRRPVDWPLRERVLDEVSAVQNRVDRRDELARWRDEMSAGHLKMLVLQSLLRLRRELGDLSAATFDVIRAEGAQASSVLAFERVLGGGVHVVVAVSRLTAGLGLERGAEVWQNTSLPSRVQTYSRVLHGGEVACPDGRIGLSSAWPVLPVEVLVGRP